MFAHGSVNFSDRRAMATLVRISQGQRRQCLSAIHVVFSASAKFAFGCGFEICRSLWDRDALIADFDIEYVNFDNPTEAFLESGTRFWDSAAGDAND